MDNSQVLSDLQESWRIFLLEWKLACYYHYPPALNGIGSVPTKNPLLEAILPTLLFLRLVSLTDEAFKHVIEDRGLSYTGFRRDFNGRIHILDNHNLLRAPAAIHDIRQRRNIFAHQTGEFASWGELEQAVTCVEAEISSLLGLSPRPELEYFGERSKMNDSPDPNLIGERTFRFGVKSDGKVALEFSWKQYLHKS